MSLFATVFARKLTFTYLNVGSGGMRGMGMGMGTGMGMNWGMGMGIGIQRPLPPAPGGKPASRVHIELNKQITRLGSAGELCELIEARSAEFDHVNVSTAFRKLLSAGRAGVHPTVRSSQAGALCDEHNGRVWIAGSGEHPPYVPWTGRRRGWVGLPRAPC